MNNNRIREFDIIKGLGILSVLVGHLIYRNPDTVADFLVNSAANGFIVVFFILSAYVYNPEKRSIKDEYINKFKTLFLPTIALAGGASVIGGIYCYFVHHFTFAQWVRNLSYTFIRFELSDLIYPDSFDAVEDVLYLDLSPTWFIWTMCFTFILFIPLAKVLHNKKTLNLICCIALLFVGTVLYVNLKQSPWNLAHVPIYTSIMLFSQLLREYDITNKIISLKPWISTLTTIVSTAIYFVLFYFILDTHMYEGQLGVFHVYKFDHWYKYHTLNNPLIGMRDTLIWTETIVFFIQGFLCMYIGFNIARLIKNSQIITNAMEWIGKRSLDFLILHCLFGLVFVDLLHTYNRPGLNWYLPNLTTTIVIKSYVTAIGALISCIVFCIIKDKIKNKLFSKN
ncbi:MAG: hypothetical protein E7254_10890 [Lachnospiraceae bacterium]|nr:hypothetical protein [Lachnospiraceae bacterium]